MIEIVADCRDGKAERIQCRERAVLRRRLDAPLEVAGLGTLSVDIAYGGDSFVIVDAAALGFAIRPDEARDLAETRHEDHRRRQRSSSASPIPRTPDWDHISFCQFAGPLAREGETC